LSALLEILLGMARLGMSVAKLGDDTTVENSGSCE